MRFLLWIGVIFGWWATFAIAGFLKDKLPPIAFNILRWVMVLPLAVAGYFSGPLFWDMGLLWPVAAYPMFVGVGMYVAPTKRAVIGVFLMLLVALSAAGEIKRAWENEKNRRWLFAGIGTTLACGVFWKMRNLEGD